MQKGYTFQRYEYPTYDKSKFYRSYNEKNAEKDQYQKTQLPQKIDWLQKSSPEKFRSLYHPQKECMVFSHEEIRLQQQKDVINVNRQPQNQFLFQKKNEQVSNDSYFQARRYIS